MSNEFSTPKLTPADAVKIPGVDGNNDSGYLLSKEVKDYIVGDLYGDAPEYSTLETYTVGERAMNEGDLYRCTTAVSVPEVFNPTKWERIDLPSLDERILESEDDIATNAAAIAQNTEDIQTNAGNIQANTDAISSLRYVGGVIKYVTKTVNLSADARGYSFGTVPDLTFNNCLILVAYAQGYYPFNVSFGSTGIWYVYCPFSGGYTGNVNINFVYVEKSNS